MIKDKMTVTERADSSCTTAIALSMRTQLLYKIHTANSYTSNIEFVASFNRDILISHSSLQLEMQGRMQCKQ